MDNNNNNSRGVAEILLLDFASNILIDLHVVILVVDLLIIQADGSRCSIDLCGRMNLGRSMRVDRRLAIDFNTELAKGMNVARNIGLDCVDVGLGTVSFDEIRSSRLDDGAVAVVYRARVLVGLLGIPVVLGIARLLHRIFPSGVHGPVLDSKLRLNLSDTLRDLLALIDGRIG